MRIACLVLQHSVSFVIANLQVLANFICINDSIWELLVTFVTVGLGELRPFVYLCEVDIYITCFNEMV